MKEAPMEPPQIYYSERHGQHIMTTKPKEEIPMTAPAWRVCDACGHTDVNAPWPDPDVCPRCFPEHRPEETPRRRRPVPIAALPTKDRLLLQALLQLSAEYIMRFHPSEQVGWLNYLLEQLDVESLAKYDRHTHANYVLRALAQEISDRLDTGRW